MKLNFKSHQFLVASGALSYCGNAITSLVTISAFSRLVSITEAFSLFFVSLALPPLILRGTINKILARHRPQRIMIIAEVLRALMVLFFATALHFEFISWPLIVVFLVVQATLATCYSSAFFTSLPTLISRAKIESYNSLSSSLTQIGYLCGASAFTMLSNQLSHFEFMVFDGTTFLISASVLYRLSKRLLVEETVTGAHAKRKLALAETIPMLGGLSVFALAGLAALPVTSLKLFNIISSTIALKHSAFGQQGYGLIDSVASAGVIASGFLISAVHGRFRVGNKGFLLLLLSIFAILALASTNRSSVILAAILAFAFGVIYSLLITIGRSSLYLLGKNESAIRDGVTMINAMESAGGISFALIMPSIIHSLGWSLLLIFSVTGLYVVLVARAMFTFHQSNREIASEPSLDKVIQTSAEG